jgi:hypothetical protein
VHAERVIERMVEKVTPTGLVNYPILSKTNYNEWSLLMNIKMEARSLWNAVVKGGAEFHVDRMALNVIWCAVTVDMITTLAVKPTAKEAWDYIETMRRCKRFGGSTSCSHSRKGRPWRISPFGSTPSCHNQLPLGMLSRTTRLPTSIFALRALRYKQHVISIDTLLDSSDLSMEDIIGRLRAAEDDGDTAFVKEGEKLYLTEEQWLEKYKEKESTGSGNRGKGAGSSKSGKGRKGAGGSGSKSGSADVGDGRSKPPTDRIRGKCHNCGKIGHWA